MLNFGINIYSFYNHRKYSSSTFLLWIQLRTDEIWLFRYVFIIRIKEKRNDKNGMTSHSLQKDIRIFYLFVYLHVFSIL